MSQTIFITGASSGLGKALAVSYAKVDVKLILTGRNKQRLLEVKKLCEKKKAEVITYVGDITHRDDFEKWLNSVLETETIDLVIANAGVSAGTAKGHESERQVNYLFDVNVHGVLNTILPVIPQMVKRKQGQIAIVGSMAGIRGLPSCPSYSASKAAVMTWGDALRGDLAKDNVKVTVIIPGYIKTPMTDVNKFPMPFMISAEDAASLIKRRLKRAPKRLVFPHLMYIATWLSSVLSPVLTDWAFAKLPGKDRLR